MCVHGGICEPPPAGESERDADGTLIYLERLELLDEAACPLQLEAESDAPAIWQLLWNDPLRFCYFLS